MFRGGGVQIQAWKKGRFEYRRKTEVDKEFHKIDLAGKMKEPQRPTLWLKILTRKFMRKHGFSCGTMTKQKFINVKILECREEILLHWHFAEKEGQGRELKKMTLFINPHPDKSLNNTSHKGR